ncbi:hypothetical protein J6590_086848 [Homalodisca vitripennis]|nr:hypothetical protein J6590_086848 [Homalodisca vitripennis]
MFASCSCVCGGAGWPGRPGVEGTLTTSAYVSSWRPDDRRGVKLNSPWVAADVGKMGGETVTAGAVTRSGGGERVSSLVPAEPESTRPPTIILASSLLPRIEREVLLHPSSSAANVETQKCNKFVLFNLKIQII